MLSVKMTDMEKPSEMRAGFGRRLRRARLAAGYTTARQLATAIQVDEKVYGNYELGKRIPDLPVLLKLCRALKVTSDYLLFDDPAGLSVQQHHKLQSEVA